MSTPQDSPDIAAALRRAFSLGQTYWQQADSESDKQNAKADVTRELFNTLVDETVAHLSTAPQPQAGWQPIETAPRDGTPVVGLCNHEADAYHEGLGLTDYGARAEGLGHVEDGPCVIAWEPSRIEQDGWEMPSYTIPAGWCSLDDPEKMANPTHWMPLPAPPKETPK